MKVLAVLLAAAAAASAATTTLPASAGSTSVPTAIPVRGSTLNNVWWVDVWVDAATLKMTSGTSTVNGGGAFKAADKVSQFNGRGTLNINDFYVNDYGKLTRSCGNCKDNGGPRNVNIKGVIAKNGGELCGINSNYGDVWKITNSCQSSGKSCVRYQGNSSGAEPTKLGSGHDGKNCILSGFSAC
ncbi:hypothetical protein S40288_02286 [Stachybotrys chartarum IBT 40288]|nr:hypothetical protein S40288_02286 [Stachybotrys chartarum IBT 40288]